MEPPAKFPKFPSTKVLKEVIGGSLETEIVIHHVKSELLVISEKAIASFSFFSLDFFLVLLTLHQQVFEFSELNLRIYNQTKLSETVHHLSPWGRS